MARARSARGTPVDAIVWRRHDFRESSRIVTLLTREHGKVRALAKGAHRPDSVLAGKIDFLAQLRVELWTRGETMPLLSRATLAHEPRGLREPLRYRLAGYLVELVDRALPDDRADPDLYDLVQGGLVLCERSPPAALAQVLAGLEWRFLALVGSQPELDVCAVSGHPLAAHAPTTLDRDGRGLCALAAAPAGVRVAPATRACLRSLGREPGANWPTLRFAPAALAEALAWTGRLVALALEHSPRSRASAARGALAAAQASLRPARRP